MTLMLTKGIIIDKIGNDNHYLVRIPILETAGDVERSVIQATLSYTPGVVESLKPEDVVIVGFENHSPDSPIIVGKLLLNDDASESRGFANLESLNVSKSVVLPEDTTIAGQSLKNLPNLIDYLLNKESSDTPVPPIPVDVETSSVALVVNTLTNINGRVLSAYESTSTTIEGYQVYRITYGGNKLTETRAANYMEYMCGNRYVPTYNYEKPKNTYFITVAGTILKPQYDSTNGLLLYIMSTVATKDYVDNLVGDIETILTNLDIGSGV